MCVLLYSHIQLFETPWTVAHQAPLSMEFFRPEFWSRYPFPSLGDLFNPGSEPGSPELQADPSPSELPREPKSTCVDRELYYWPDIKAECIAYAKALKS